MKELTLLLLFNFSILALLPLAPAFNYSAENCEMVCMAEEMEDEECAAGMACCPANNCSPFQCCFFCCLCTTGDQKMQLGISENDIVKYVNYQGFIPDGYKRTCWQPPELTGSLFS